MTFSQNFRIRDVENTQNLNELLKAKRDFNPFKKERNNFVQGYGDITNQSEPLNKVVISSIPKALQNLG